MATLAPTDSLAPSRPAFAAGTLGLLLVAGLYFPTSRSEQFSTLLLAINYLLCFVLLARLGLSARRAPRLATCLGALLIVPLLLFFTFISGFHTYTYGALAGYAVLSTLFLLDLRDVPSPPWLTRLYAVVHAINIAVSVAILAGSDVVRAVLVTHYTVFYPELVPTMLAFRKPVLTFGTHSLAGFFMYLFFYSCFQTYKLRRKTLFLIFALCYLFLTFALLSVTGLVLGLLAATQIAFHFWPLFRRRWAWIAALFVGIVAVAAVAPHDSLLRNARDAFKVGSAILVGPESSGLRTRYLPGGTLYYDVQYVKQHPFRPVGVSFREGLMLGDSGIMEYFLRGSIFLVFLVYGGLLLFLRRSLIARADVYLLFGVIVAFEIGIPALTYCRTLYFLPFLVVYLNGLRRPAPAKL